MTLEQLKPNIMRQEIMLALRQASVFRNFCNENFDGEIKTRGQSVTFPGIGKLTAASYTGATITYNEPTDLSQTLIVDQAAHVAVRMTDINRIQTVAGVYPAIATEMGASIGEYLDTALSTGIYAQAGIVTDLSSTGVDSSNIFQELLNLRAKFKLKNVNERLPLFCDPYMVNAMAACSTYVKLSNDEVFATGVVGRIAGFDIIETNALTTTGTYAGGDLVVNACAFTPNRSVALAVQKEFNIEMLRAEGTYDDLMRAMVLYGWKVLRADEVAHFKVKVNVESSI